MRPTTTTTKNTISLNEDTSDVQIHGKSQLDVIQWSDASLFSILDVGYLSFFYDFPNIVWIQVLGIPRVYQEYGQIKQNYFKELRTKLTVDSAFNL